MCPIAVIDTNVLVGGLLSSTPGSPLTTIVDGMLSGRFPFRLSPALLNEYRSVLSRPSLCRRHGLAPDEIEQLLIEITANALWHEPAAMTDAGAPDPGDDHLWRLLRSAGNTVLVTGDRLLREQPPDFAGIMSPRAFVDQLD